MWRKIVRVVGFLLAVALIVAYICYASNLAQRNRSTQRVEQVVISLPDSADLCRFTSVPQMRNYLNNGKFALENVVVDSIDAVTISEHIMKCGFVRDVDVYTTYSGELHIDIRQHKPLVRLLCGGYNSYITGEGDIFHSPRGGAYYAPVITGCYKPMFKTDFEGRLLTNFEYLMALEDEKLAAVCNAIAVAKQEKRRCNARIDELKKSRKKGVFERLFGSEEEYKLRLVGIKMEIDKQVKTEAEIASRLLLLNKDKHKVESRKKKIEKRYDDFANLINFVSQIEHDSFWGSEIVQYVADTTSLGEISLRLIPRSGDFIVEFGRLADREEKLSKLQKYYDEGLSQFGWDRYKKVDLRYKKQIICTE